MNKYSKTLVNLSAAIGLSISSAAFADNIESVLDKNKVFHNTTSSSSINSIVVPVYDSLSIQGLVDKQRHEFNEKHNVRTQTIVELGTHNNSRQIGARELHLKL